jgi:hypothetical protein
VPPKVYPHIAAIGPTQVRKRLRKRRKLNLQKRIVFVGPPDHADPSHALALLRPRRQRPSHSAAKTRNKFAPSHLQSSSLNRHVEN